MTTQLHILKAGTHTATSGATLTFTAADLADIASSYNPAQHEAPIVIGHPHTDAPAWGWIKSLRAEGGDLYAEEHQVDPDFAELRAQKKYKKISVSLYDKADPANPTPGKYYLRHVGYLGAQPPAIKGLRNFSAPDGGLQFDFAEPEPATQPQPPRKPTMTPDEIAALQAQATAAAAAQAKAEAETAALRQQVEAANTAQAAARHAANLQFAETHSKTGQLLPADCAPLVALLDTLSAPGTAAIQFSEGAITKQADPAQWLQEFVKRARPQIQFGEHQANGQPVTLPGKGASDADIDAAAKAYASQHKLSYAEALNHVVTL